VAEWKKWLVWDGRRWVISNHALEAAKTVAAQVKREVESACLAGDITRDEVKSLRQFANHTASGKGLREMLFVAATDPRIAVEPDQLDAWPWLLNVANGMIDLRTGDLLPHEPDRLLTQLCPHDY